MPVSRSRKKHDERTLRQELINDLVSLPRTRKLIKKWENEQYEKEVGALYEQDDEDSKKSGPSENQYTDPPRYADSAEAMTALSKKKLLLLAAKENEGASNPKIDLADCLNILKSTVAFTVDAANRESPSLLTYDYDNRVYTYSDAILNEYIVTLMGTVSRSSLQSVTMSLLGSRRELAAFVPLPDYKVAVGNGTFNCLTNELEEDDPRYITTEKIDTDYKPGAPYNGQGEAASWNFTRLCSDLANFEPDRRQLIQQICKAIVTGHSVAPATFIILGRGGDGKSTFFQLLVNTIGKTNCAFVNFTEMNQPDKMAETINKKLVLGMDNDVNVYISKTALLKSISSHEYITHSRKYERAVSVKFSGTLVQLCNEMPRFAETGDSMRRRLICFYAENSHYALNSEAPIVSTLIEEPEFLEHTLSSILDANQTPFYKDFNDIDSDHVKTTLDNEDILAQFTAEMNAIGVLSKVNTYIPASHLYAVYRDWMKSTSPSASALSFASFSQRIGKQMAEHGYEMSQTLGVTSPSSIMSTGSYSPDIFGTYSDGQELTSIVEGNAVTRVFERTGEPSKKKERRRGAHRCTSLEFFGVFNDFHVWMRDHDLELFKAINEPLKNAGSIGNDFKSKIDEFYDDDYSADVNVEEVELTESRKAQIEAQDFRQRIVAPVDIRGAFKTRDLDQIDRYREWLNNIENIEPSNNNEVIMKASELDQAARFMAQIAKQEKDSELSQLSEAVADNSGVQSIQYAREFVAELRARVSESIVSNDE